MIQFFRRFYTYRPSLSRIIFPPPVLFSRRYSICLSMEPVDLDGLRASVVKQGGLVRQLKKDGASQEEVTLGRVWCISLLVLTLF